MSYKGKYKPSNPEKYNGNVTNIIYRSLWERKFLYYCDMNENILEYSSEEMFVWYKSPVDGKPHRYYPDFLIKVKESDGTIKKYMIEIKPKKYGKKLGGSVRRRKSSRKSKKRTTRRH